MARPARHRYPAGAATRRIALPRPLRAALLLALVIVTTSAPAARAAAPSAVVDGPDAVETGVPIGFDAEGSTDPDGEPLSFLWTVDGQILDIDQTWLSISFAHPGRHVVAVTVSDPAGASGTAARVVQVSGADRTQDEVSPLQGLVAPASEPAVPDLALRPPSVRVRRHALRLRVRCHGARACHGYLRAVALVGRGAHEHALLLSRRRFAVQRGRRLVHLWLRHAARRRLRAHPRVRVTAYLGRVGASHVWAATVYRVHRR